MLFLSCWCFLCLQWTQEEKRKKHPHVILGNLTPSYFPWGYRDNTEAQPTLHNSKTMYAFSTPGYRLLRTYNLQFEHTPNLIRAQNQSRRSDFRNVPHVGDLIDQKMLTAARSRARKPENNNNKTGRTAIVLSKQYPDTIKIIAGNGPWYTGGCLRK